MAILIICSYNFSSLNLSDIKDQIKYWESAVVCFVIGANPPLHVIDGFVRHIWKDLDIDTVGMVDKGVFMVRMKSAKSRDKAYESNGVLFDNKPFVIKPWKPEMSIEKSCLSSMPVWIQLPKLKIEYRSECSLKKIAGLVGNVIKLDSATQQKARLRFARILVDMNINDEFPEEIHFTNVHDKLVTQQVVYEWKSILCTKCHKMGHNDQECSSEPNKNKATNDKRPRKDKDGFQMVVRKMYVVKQKPSIQENKGTEANVAKEQSAPSTLVDQTATKSSPRPRSPRGHQHHEEITSPNLFAALEKDTVDNTREETTTMKLPIKALGVHPIDDNE